MGWGNKIVNDIEILQEMLISQAQVPLQQEQGRVSVELTDMQAKTTVVIKELPHDSNCYQNGRFLNLDVLSFRVQRTNAGGLIM